ncbi:MAG: sugar phosphate isomerase/epimerase [Spirochaetia bacterium]|nr:sugar phosphate isomerase/epimerase [Spirochaetia bacterium]
MENRIKNLHFCPSYDGFVAGNKSVSETIDICRKAGFYGIEGWADHGFFTGSLKDFTKLGEAFKAAGLVINTFHLPYEQPVLDDIATLYELDRTRVVERMKYWIERAAACGAKIGILHPTTRAAINGLSCYDADKEGLDKLCGQANKSLQAMLKFGEQFGFKIAIENMPPRSGGRLGSRNEHMIKLYEENKHPNLGFCLDTGHALLSYGKDAMKAYYAMEEHLIAFHLADNAGDRDSHLLPGHGHFPWNDFFKALNKRGFSDTVCVETPPFDIGPDFSTDAWCNMFKELNELVDKSFKEN